MGRRIDIETDDVADLGGELRIVGKLEGTNAVRRQAMSAPEALKRFPQIPVMPSAAV